MAIRRTLKDKKKAVERRESISYQWQKPTGLSAQELPSNIASPKRPDSGNTTLSDTILGYPLSLIYKDILKTIVSTIFLCFVLVALFIWWK